MEKEYVYQGRIAISKPREVGGVFNQHSISGVLITDTGQPLLSNAIDWENVQCEIIIRPIKKIGIAKRKHMRLDQVAQCLSDENEWM